MKRNEKKQRVVLTEHRRQLTLERLRERGVVKTSELSSAFSVSPMTVRNDLNALAEQGQLVRVHGGAMAKEWLAVEPSYQEKANLYVEEKRRIGARAAELVQEGMAVFIGNGTTTMQIVHYLVEQPRGPYRVFTNSLNHAMELTHAPNAEVYVIGGYLRGVSYAMVGPLAQQGLSNVFFDLALLGANGITLEHGVTIPSLEEAETASDVVRRAQRTVVVADHSKFGTVTHGKVVSLDQIVQVISDENLEQQFQRLLTDVGADVALV